MTFTTRLRPRYDAPRKHQLPSTNHQGGPRRRLTLREIGGRKLGQPHLPDGSRPMVWAIRNHERWADVADGEIARWYRRPGEAPLG